MEDPVECVQKCQLYAHVTGGRLPPGGALAWEVHSRLASPAVEKFGLQREALESLNLRLDWRRRRQLLADLDEIVIGIQEAGKPEGS